MRTDITELSIHLDCGHICGPLPQVGDFPRWQPCSCQQGHTEWPKGTDLCHFYELCRVCASGMAQAGPSKWSWYGCETCKAVNRSFHQILGWQPLGLGRHSMMNTAGPFTRQQALSRRHDVISAGPEDPAQEPSAGLSLLAAGLQQSFDRMTSLRDWGMLEFRQLVEKLPANLRSEHYIPVRVWQQYFPVSRAHSARMIADAAHEPDLASLVPTDWQDTGSGITAWYPESMVSQLPPVADSETKVDEMVVDFSAPSTLCYLCGHGIIREGHGALGYNCDLVHTRIGQIWGFPPIPGRRDVPSLKSSSAITWRVLRPTETAPWVAALPTDADLAAWRDMQLRPVLAAAREQFGVSAMVPAQVWEQQFPVSLERTVAAFNQFLGRDDCGNMLHPAQWPKP